MLCRALFLLSLTRNHHACMRDSKSWLEHRGTDLAAVCVRGRCVCVCVCVCVHLYAHGTEAPCAEQIPRP